MERMKKLKSSLVQTRSTIKKKFQKLHNNRVKDERKLKEKYEPITKSIKKLIDSKQEMLKLKQEIGSHDDENDDDVGVGGENEHNRNSRPVSRVGVNTNMDMNIIQNDMPVAEDVNDFYHPAEGIHFDLDDEYVEIENDAQYGAHDLTSLEQMDFDEMRNKRKKSLNSNDGEPSTSAKSGETEKRRKVSSNPSEVVEITKNMMKNTQKKKKSAIERKEEQLNKLHDLRKSGVTEFMKKQKTKNVVPSADPEPDTIILSPEDYDDSGNYKGRIKQKRSKVVIPKTQFKETLKRIANRRKSAAKQYLRRSARNKGRPLIKYGKGLEKKFIPFTSNIVYEYYDDPNELCDRLRLLVSSKAAGNSNHDQEINSIVEELRERRIIR